MFSRFEQQVLAEMEICFYARALPPAELSKQASCALV